MPVEGEVPASLLHLRKDGAWQGKESKKDLRKRRLEMEERLVMKKLHLLHGLGLAPGTMGTGNVEEDT